MSVPIVTVVDERYAAGLTALYQSYLENSKTDCDFYAIVYGSDEYVDRILDVGISVLPRAAIDLPDLPVGRQSHWQNPAQMPAMYARLMIPDLFTSKYAIYVDADSLILQNLSWLKHRHPFKQTIAATRCNSPLHENITGNGLDLGSGYGPMSSLVIFDNERWRERQYLKICKEAIANPKLRFPYMVQGVLQYAVGRDWHQLPWATQAHAGHTTLAESEPHEVYTLHFMGTKPWDPIPANLQAHYQKRPDKMKAREIWEGYYQAGAKI